MPLPRVKLACVLFSSALVLSPVALAGCDRLAATDPAQAARVAASASAELGVLAEKGADSVVVAPTAAETPQAAPGEQTVIPPAASADVTPEAAALSPADFTNSILFDATRAPNDKVFEVDALGSWKLLGVLDANGTVTTAAERGPMALTFRGKGGTVETEREKLPLTWSQDDETPQLAHGDFGDDVADVVSMDLNDDGRLVVRQGAMGRVLLFAKVG